MDLNKNFELKLKTTEPNASVMKFSNKSIMIDINENKDIEEKPRNNQIEYFDISKTFFDIEESKIIELEEDVTMNINETKRTEILDPKASLTPQVGSELKIDSIFNENEDDLNKEMMHIQNFSHTLEAGMLWCNSRDFMRILNSKEKIVKQTGSEMDKIETEIFKDHNDLTSGKKVESNPSTPFGLFFNPQEYRKNLYRLGMKAKITDRKPEKGNRELKNEKKKEMGTEIKEKNRLIHQCGQCQMIFKSNYSLKSHEISVHDSKKAFQCTVCPTKFTNSGNLKMHMMIHTGEKNFVCNLCEYKCNRSDSLKKHMLTHLKNRVKPHKCPTCKSAFLTAYYMKKHIATAHEGIMPYACHVCAKRFKSKTGLDYHVTLKHDANGKTYDESTNPEEYKDNPKLAEILQRKAANLKKSVCILCDKAVFRKSNHIKTVHTDLEGNVKCPKCDKSFTCFRFAYSHARTVHIKDSCTICGQMIGKKPMAGHMQWKHGINPPLKKYNCEFCEKKFVFKNSLSDHRNTHTGEKPYLCKFCDKGFSSFGNHRSHENVHLGIKRKKQKVSKNLISTDNILVTKRKKKGENQYHK